MRALIDAHMLGQRETGNETYVRGLLRGFAALDRPQSVAVCEDADGGASDGELAAPFPSSPGEAEQTRAALAGHDLLRLGHGSNMARLLAELPLLALQAGVDVVHTTYIVPPIIDRALVVTIHDVSFLRRPEMFTARDRLLLTSGVNAATRQAQRIIVPSRYSHDDVLDMLPAAEGRMVVTPEGVLPQFHLLPQDRVDEVLQRLDIDGPYVLALGNLQPRKNLLRLLGAWRRLVADGHDEGCRLVLAGGLHGRATPVRDAIAALSLGDRVLLPGYVADDDLPALYNGSRAFVFSSLYEGFGLPLLEAMACGTPVACSRATSLPEVGGAAAAYFDPCDIDDIAATIAALIGDETLRGDLRRRGLERVKVFTWERCAELTLATYEQAAAEFAADGRRPAARVIRSTGRALEGWLAGLGGESRAHAR